MSARKRTLWTLLWEFVCKQQVLQQSVIYLPKVWVSPMLNCLLIFGDDSRATKPCFGCPVCNKCLKSHMFRFCKFSLARRFKIYLCKSSYTQVGSWNRRVPLIRLFWECACFLWVSNVYYKFRIREVCASVCVWQAADAETSFVHKSCASKSLPDRPLKFPHWPAPLAEGRSF